MRSLIMEEEVRITKTEARTRRAKDTISQSTRSSQRGDSGVKLLSAHAEDPPVGRREGNGSRKSSFLLFLSSVHDGAATATAATYTRRETSDLSHAPSVRT